MRISFLSIGLAFVLSPLVTVYADEEATIALSNQLMQVQQRLAALEQRLSAPPGAVAAAPPARAGSAYMNISFDAVANGGWSSEPHPGDALQLGDHDPQQRGFSLRNAEMALDGAVDPYLKGFANIVLKLDDQNSTEVELEETYLQTTSLPGDLQLKAGQFFAAFGRQNSQHPHAWAFVDQPLVMNRMFGGDGLRNVGAQASWLAPLPAYTEVTLGVFNGEGTTAWNFRDTEESHGRTPVDRGLSGPGNLLYVPRIASSFDLTDCQTLVLGASGAFGPNDSGSNTTTRIYGVDSYWKWKSPRAHAGFPFVSWQTEVMRGEYEAGADPVQNLTDETLTDWGAYSQILVGCAEGWVIGVRGDYVDGNKGQYDASDLYRGQRDRIAPNLTWYPSEFSKLRLQYNIDHGERFGNAQSVWCQVEFLLGAHAAHKF